MTNILRLTPDTTSVYTYWSTEAQAGAQTVDASGYRPAIYIHTWRVGEYSLPKLVHIFTYCPPTAAPAANEKAPSAPQSASLLTFLKILTLNSSPKGWGVVFSRFVCLFIC